MSGRRTLTTAIAAGALAATAGAAAANPADVVGFGARGAAMAGAQAAAGDDGTVSYYNPALLARFTDIHIDLGYQLAAPQLALDDHAVDVDPSHGTVITLAVPGEIGGVRLAIGTALFLPDQHLTRTRALPSQQPRFSLYDNRPQRVLLAVNAAVALGPRVVIGGGVGYMSSTKGEVQLLGRIGFPDPDDSDLDVAIDVDLESISYPHLGVAWAATPWLDLAVTYRGGFALEVDQTFDLRGDVGTAIEDGFFTLRSQSQDLFQPAQVTAGASARITPRFGLAFDLAWHRWSVYDNPTARIDLALDAGTLDDLFDLPEAVLLPPPNFHDILVPRLGLEWLAAAAPGWALRVRAGYAYEPTPAPEQIGATNFVDNDKHTVSLGAGIELPGLGGILLRPLSLDAFVAITAFEPRDHRKLSPVDVVGDYRSSGHVLAGGLTSRWRF